MDLADLEKWQNDEDKLTFIILARQPEDRLPDDTDVQGLSASVYPEDPRIMALPMVGDVNLFLKGTRPGIIASGNVGEEEDDFEVEIEIMIAGKQFLIMLSE